MPRKARNLFDGKELFHVMVQGIKKERIFINEREKLEYIKLINQFSETYKVKIIAYCIMDNHAHLLVYTKSINGLTEYMHRLNTSYAIYYNKNKNRVGYVYRDRFKTQLIKDREHLLNCIIYIHNNPVKAGICILPKQFKYSSYELFMSKKNENILKSLFIDKYEYEKAHINKRINNMNFLEEEEQLEKEIKDDIDYYLKEKNISLNELKFNNELLFPIAKKLKEQYGLSKSKIANYLEANREKIRIIIN